MWSTEDYVFLEGKIPRTPSPLDTCISIFQHPLLGQEYANKPEDLAEHFIGCSELIKHWQLLHSENIVNVYYEHLVSEPDNQIEKLLTEVGLEFELACLSPEKNKRPVFTPSSTQVRKPINTGSIGKWKLFEPFMASLIAPLAYLEKLYQTQLKSR